MASLFHPKYVRTDSETGEKVTRRLAKWYGRYRDANGVIQKVPLCTDKTAAQAMLTELVRKAERQQAGLIDPATEHLARAIQGHIEEFRNHLLAKARSEFHISETIRLITAFTTKCRLNILAELQGAGTALEGYLADRKQSGSSHRTINADLTAVRSFCRWLLSKKRMHDDPTAGLSKLNEDEDPRRERRPLSDEEAQKLVETTNASTVVFRKLTGQDRAMMYLLAQRTGLRRGELRSLTGRSLDLTSDPPTVAVKARSSKRRKKELLPLSKDTAEAFVVLLAEPRSELATLAGFLVATIGRHASHRPQQRRHCSGRRSRPDRRFSWPADNIYYQSCPRRCKTRHRPETRPSQRHQSDFGHLHPVGHGRPGRRSQQSSRTPFGLPPNCRATARTLSISGPPGCWFEPPRRFLAQVVRTDPKGDHRHSRRLPIRPFQPVTAMSRIYSSIYRRLSLSVSDRHQSAQAPLVKHLTKKCITPCKTRGLASSGTDCQSGGHGIRTHNRFLGI